MDHPFLVFEERPTRAGMKTKVWAVRSKRTNIVLGFIRWYGAWRQYTLFPEPGTIWNNGCLLGIVRFIEEEHFARREADEAVHAGS